MSDERPEQNGGRTKEENAAVEAYLEAAASNAERDDLRAVWVRLGALPALEADSARLRARFDAMLDAAEQVHDEPGQLAAPPPSPARASFSSRWTGHLARAAAAVLLLGGGVLIGQRSAAPAPAPQATPSTDIASLRGELQDLREMVTLSLMQQQSASERLKGVSWSGQIDRPSNEVVSALLDALMHDPNVNVRLATIDALERFSGDAIVRRGALQAVNQQASPLVQIALIDFMVNANERESAPALRRLADDPQVNQAVRERAARGLQQLG